MQPTKLLFVSNHPMWIQTLCQVAEGFSIKFEVTGVLTDDVLSTELKIALHTQPSIIFTLLGFPCAGPNYIRTLRATGCQIPIIAYCSFEAVPDFEELVKYDVQGIATTSISLQELEAFIYAVAEGRSDTLTYQYQQIIRSSSQCFVKECLSKREKEILCLVALDLTDQEIADHLQLSVKTINNHLRYIYAKLGVKSRAGALFRAIIKGSINPHTVLESFHSS